MKDTKKMPNASLKRNNFFDVLMSPKAKRIRDLKDLDKENEEKTKK
jgi:hypothetical protein